MEAEQATEVRVSIMCCASGVTDQASLQVWVDNEMGAMLESLELSGESQENILRFLAIFILDDIADLLGSKEDILLMLKGALAEYTARGEVFSAVIASVNQPLTTENANTYMVRALEMVDREISAMENLEAATNPLLFPEGTSQSLH